MLDTQSHATAYQKLLSIGELFFRSPPRLPNVKLRLSPLLVGPTGAGKSYLVERTGRTLDAAYFKITRGDWLVTGGRGRSTTFQILDFLLAHPRVLLHLDELDKFQIDFRHEWGAAMAADLWNILDGKFQLDAYIRETDFGDAAKPKPAEIVPLVQKRLWIVGSGTWQDLFVQRRERKSLGFGSPVESDTVNLEAVAKAGVISPELLHRFAGDLIFVEYPTPEETEELLESSGIGELARSLQMKITAADLDWSHGGIRVLETLATRLVLERHMRERGQHREIDIA
ncbi:MAG TPA: AAA family ATPase [Opitutaceae bacterium]|nr:AAA family ATPase [Opitutaceae bacterium]